MKFFTLLLFCALFCYPSLSLAQDRLYLSAGYYDVFDDQDGLDLRAEYRWDYDIFETPIKPFVGLEVTSEGSLWSGSGVFYDAQISSHVYLTPSVGVGLYDDGGSDIDLDHPIQFRTQIEISYEFESTMRMSAGLSHMSNAGLGDSNPGVEVFSLGWSQAF